MSIGRATWNTTVRHLCAISNDYGLMTSDHELRKEWIKKHTSATLQTFSSRMDDLSQSKNWPGQIPSSLFLLSCGRMLLLDRAEDLPSLLFWVQRKLLYFLRPLDLASAVIIRPQSPDSVTQLSVSGVQEMQTRCQLHFGGMIGDGGRRADRGITERRRRERPSQLFCVLSYAARPSGITGNAAREDLSTCICRRGLITGLLFPLFEGIFKMSEVCRRWLCVKSLV